MKEKKDFDCVEMKNAIQAKHRKEREGLTDQEVRQLVSRRLATSDNPIAQWWRDLVKANLQKAGKS